MIRCLVTGRLHDTPQARTSATGNTFAVCSFSFKVMACCRSGQSRTLAAKSMTANP